MIIIRKGIICLIILLCSSPFLLAVEDNLEEFINNRFAWFGQSSFILISKSGQVVYIDPVKIPPNYAQADLILVTHSHYDHYNPAMIKSLQKDGTKVVVPANMAKYDWIGLTEWQTIRVGDYHITGVPAYNINKSYHPHSKNWLGYIIQIDDIRIYHAGDTDLIPEMQRVNCNIALLPVGGRYTMGVTEAVKATEVIDADFYIPMHYGSIIGNRDDGLAFARQVKRGEVRVLNPVY